MNSQAEFTIFVVDDDAAVRKALARLLKAANYETQCFASGQEFLAAHDPARRGCAIVDLTMDGIQGLQLQDMLQVDGIQRPIVFLTGNGDISSSVKAIQAGAVDFLTKPVKRDRLLAAIERANEIDKQGAQARAELQSINERLSMLTRREREVLQYVVAGRLNKQIAATIGTVEKTVKVHRARMMTKLGVRCVADLVRLSERAGIVPLGTPYERVSP